MTRTDQPTSANLRPDSADLKRLLAGEHHNPHSILGAHEYDDHTVIRAFRPHAVEVVALVGDDRFPMEHVESGLFAVALPFADLIDYRLQVSYQGAGDSLDTHTLADAYRFLPTLGEIDCICSPRAATSTSGRFSARIPGPSPRPTGSWRGCRSRCGRPMPGASA